MQTLHSAYPKISQATQTTPCRCCFGITSWRQRSLCGFKLPWKILKCLMTWRHGSTSLDFIGWLMLIDWSICLVGLTFTIDLTLLCMCWFMWACRSRHHYNESSTGLVCTWRHCKAVPCLYCFGLRDVNKKWRKVSKWTGKILPFVKCNVMAFVLIMVYVVMALWQDSAMTSGNRKQHSWENSWMNTPRTGLCLSPFANDNDSSSQSSSMRRSSWFGAGILQHISHTRYEMVWDDEMSHHAAICLLVILPWIIMTESDCCCCHSRMLTSKWICR